MSEEIRQTQVLTAALFDRLARECETHFFGAFVVFVDDQIVAFRLTREITVNQFCFEQFFADRLRFDLGEFRIDGFFENFLIFFRRFSALFILPLTFEKRGFVDEIENFCQIFDLDDL